MNFKVFLAFIEKRNGGKCLVRLKFCFGFPYFYGLASFSLENFV